MSLITKNKEVELLLNLLEGNGSFAEKFGKDIPVMIENIKKDFPIENGTSIIADEVKHIREKEQLLQKYENEIRQLKKEHEAKLQELYLFFLKSDDEKMYNKVVADLGIEKTIKLKHQHQLPFTESEINYMVNKLK
jgi:S-adenosylmethionine synthetase